MPPEITRLPDDGGPYPATTPVPADSGWLDTVQTAIASPTTVTTLTAFSAFALGATAAYLLTRRPSKTDDSKAGQKLMYAPLVLVNLAAIYGQVAYAYEHIAPEPWNMASKVALAIMFAAAIESIAVYVGWHAHDALLQKATATAARLRRASYGLAGLVGAINYAHFAGEKLAPTAASVAFGLLSLLSPWLWGLHTRRAQHVRLTREGAVDATGATFSGERIRAFPIRSYMARRWSIDNYVTDPRVAWEGYNADLRARRAENPGTRVRAAWRVLRGNAHIEAGVVPGHNPVNGSDIRPAIDPDITRATDPDITRATDPDVSTDITSGQDTDIDLAITADTETGTQTDTTNQPAPTPRPDTEPARMPAQKRAENPGNGRTRKPSSLQVKAFKLRAQNPDITWTQLALKVGANERTVRRWFEAARPADDAPEERASRPAIMPDFARPKELVSAGVNGNHFDPKDN